MTKATEHREVSASDGLRFHVARRGTGPTIVLLHGFTGSTETWDALQRGLEERFTTIAVDITGHGKSSAPRDPDRYALSCFARDLRDVLDVLGISRAVVLGYSMGGRAALRFALANPDRVAGLILESTSPGIENELERAVRTEADSSLAGEIERDGIVAFVGRWERLPLWNSLATMPAEALDRLRAQRLTNRAEGLAGSLRGAGAGAEAPVFDQLSAIRTSVRIVCGALDRKYVELGQTMEAAMPSALLSVVPNAGHMVHLEQPERFAAVVSDFLEERVGEAGDWL